MGRNKIYSTLGATSHTDHERAAHDLYCTPPEAIDRLLKGGAEIDKNVWECCCGLGHLSEKLKSLGYEVYSSDLIDRGYGEGGIDFLEYYERFNGTILTNPPYCLATPIIEHALEIIEDGCRVYMLMRLQYLEGIKRARLFDSGQLETVYVFRKRIACAMNGDFLNYKSAVCYAWFCFKKGANVKPVIKWI